MKAFVCTKYGPPEVLQLKDVAKPIPRDNEVLIKIHASAVTVSDCLVRSGKVNILFWLPMRLFVGFSRPRKPILGFDLAGEIVQIGKNAKRFKPGDSVCAFTGKNFGAFAEYVCLPENGLHMPVDSLVALKPAHLTYAEAAAVPSRGTLALYFLKKGNIHQNQKILIFGAAGGVGTFAIQLAKYFGAKITGVCSTANLDWVKSLGADEVIDYTQEDFTAKSERYDLIFDAVGKRYSSKLQYKKALTSNGKFISVDNHPKITIFDLLSLQEILASQKIKPVIGRTYAWEQLPEAHRYVETGHKKGNVVITIIQDEISQ